MRTGDKDRGQGRGDSTDKDTDKDRGQGHGDSVNRDTDKDRGQGHGDSVNKLLRTDLWRAAALVIYRNSASAHTRNTHEQTPTRANTGTSKPPLPHSGTSVPSSRHLAFPHSGTP